MGNYMTKQGDMPLDFDDVEEISEITADEFNVHEINSIKKKYPKLRQKSKGP